MAEIYLKKLHKRYDNGFHAVKGIDLQIADREFMVLVGPSGCGKTTSLRMVAGLEDVSEGDIAIDGKRINDVEPKDRDLAFVFQNYALYPHMTVAENMGYAMRLRGVPKTEIARKVGEAAKLLSLDSMLSRYPRQLSGGQRQRVALGRAIVRQPKAFLFDEPLSNLDAKLRGDMRFELKKLQHQLATTMVYVTHDQVEAMTLGDRITVMNHGEIQQVGAPMHIYDHPWNRFVAGFLGTPTMNFLDVSAIGAEAGGSLRCGGAILPMAMVPDPGVASTLSGRPLVLGIRPEHLAHAAHVAPPPGSATLGARVELIEAMGDHQFVYLSVAGRSAPLVMKSPCEHRCAAGEDIRVHLLLGKAHLFDGPGDDARNLSIPPDIPQIQPPRRWGLAADSM